MTALTRPVARVLRQARPRALVVTLTPAGAGPAAIEIRELGRRTGFTVAIETLFTQLALRAAERHLEEKRARRRAS